jgi:hypothetical protein
MTLRRGGEAPVPLWGDNWPAKVHAALHLQLASEQLAVSLTRHGPFSSSASIPIEAAR